ncbi:GNAT family N-acetyltransferase [Sphingomicrobium nitratireducens]|uniref:GNAT family N-acetyltransferase n=1 Tax=Sphingomicrobium nitratireducens TaxID=2964666 RepID=UPI00223E945E|nr:GNAT family N-acetyltransferase [Sphingomicrobium nitratireducens]
MVTIRPATRDDAEALWSLLEPVIREGETYAFDRDMSRDRLLQKWLHHRAFIAEDDDGGAVGTYFLKRNHGGGGGHVANCGYVTDPSARGQGVARLMAEHSFEEARRQGFKAMQYNCVVSTNTGALRLWHLLGFRIVGTIPKGFEHPTRGLVDAYVMYRWLGD